MKKLLLILMALILCVGMLSCGGKKTDGKTDGTGDAADTTEASTDEMPVPEAGTNKYASIVKNVFSEDEYKAYYELYYVSGPGDDLDKELTKEGIFTRIYDNFYDTERFYIWGYMDEDMIYDYQWEFVPKDKENLPPLGSHVKMTGKFVKDEEGADGYWFADATLEVIEEYQGELAEIDLTTMSHTLARLQLQNMTYFPTNYSGKSLKVYGRPTSEGGIQHPYADGVWSYPVDFDGDIPEDGWITITGEFYGTYREDCKVIATTVDAE